MTSSNINKLSKYSEGDTEYSVHLSILVSVIFTFVISFIVLGVENGQLVREIHLPSAITKRNPEGNVETFLGRFSFIDKGDIDTEIDLYVKKTNPKIVLAIFMEITNGDYNRKLKNTIISIAYKSGIKYNNQALLRTTAFEYLLGRFTDKDYYKSRTLLEKKVLEGDRIADYAWGLWWAAKENVNGDMEVAKKYFCRSASAGYSPANKIININSWYCSLEKNS